MPRTDPSFKYGLPRRCGSRRTLSGVVGLAASIAWGCGGDDAGTADLGDSGTGGLIIIGGGGASGHGATSGGGNMAATGGAATASGGRGKGTGATGSAGRANGGATNGGATNGGARNGGARNGGATNGGTTNGGATNGGGPTGQPVGSICVNDSNCNQSQGVAVCCAIPGCTGPCECRLTAQCPKGQLFLECQAAKDCAAYGGGKVCCEAGSGAQTMRYCTKPNGCTGTVLP